MSSGAAEHHRRDGDADHSLHDSRAFSNVPGHCQTGSYCADRIVVLPLRDLETRAETEQTRQIAEFGQAGGHGSRLEGRPLAASALGALACQLQGGLRLLENRLYVRRRQFIQRHAEPLLHLIGLRPLGKA
jgi:hypothetical protein